jgi:LysR family transcriptional regulator, low CO2-responsive transcriptional regulator
MNSSASARSAKTELRGNIFWCANPAQARAPRSKFILPIFGGRLDNLGTDMGSNETIKQAVMAGLGIAFISAHTIEQEVEFGRLVLLDVVGLPVHRQWFAVSRSDRKLSHALAAFQDFLTARGPQHLPDIAMPI